MDTASGCLACALEELTNNPNHYEAEQHTCKIGTETGSGSKGSASAYTLDNYQQDTGLTAIYPHSGSGNEDAANYCILVSSEKPVRSPISSKSSTETHPTSQPTQQNTTTSTQNSEKTSSKNSGTSSGTPVSSPRNSAQHSEASQPTTSVSSTPGKSAESFTGVETSARTAGSFCAKGDAGKTGQSATGIKLTCKITGSDSSFRWRE